MSLGDRILSGLRTIVLIEERTRLLEDALKTLRTKLDGSIADHEKRLVRIETVIELTRHDGAVLRIGRDPAQTE